MANQSIITEWSAWDTLNCRESFNLSLGCVFLYSKYSRVISSGYEEERIDNKNYITDIEDNKDNRTLIKL
ncbi:MAG: hypothetical protein ACFFD4_30670 [Candidatus Odinarchaeota archaeon]